MSPHLLPGEPTRLLLRVSARSRGFTFVELLVTVGIAAAVITVAVLVYGTVSRSNNHSVYGAVALPAGTLAALYSGTSTNNTVQAYFAPNYGRTEKAELLRESLYNDIAHASAVFCLARTGLSSIRPLTFPINSSADFRQCDSAEAFRLLLAAQVPASATVFSSYRGAAAATNLSIFVIMPSDNAPYLTVRAVYELDFVSTTSPAGTYASVRRFQGESCTDFYDVFYPTSVLTAAFAPTVVQFERKARSGTVDGNTVDQFKRAANRPFYFVWWPDPAMTTLTSDNPANAYNLSDPRTSYAGVAGRTSFFMVLPMFPAL